MSSSSSENSADKEEKVTFPLPDSAQRVTMTNSSLLNVPGQPERPPKQRRAKVVLEPGHSPLDWANKKKNSSVEQLTVLPSILRKYFTNSRA